jgi:hypothetical protein
VLATFFLQRTQLKQMLHLPQEEVFHLPDLPESPLFLALLQFLALTPVLLLKVLNMMTRSIRWLKRL